MDTLKGKQIMVWTFMGNARMYEALRDYGDRISQIGLSIYKSADVSDAGAGSDKKERSYHFERRSSFSVESAVRM